MNSAVNCIQELCPRTTMTMTTSYRIVQDSILEAGINLYFWFFYSSLYIGFCMFWSFIGSGAVGASEVVFSFKLLPVLAQSTFKCLYIWCLYNILWDTVPVVCDWKTKEVVI